MAERRAERGRVYRDQEQVALTGEVPCRSLGGLIAQGVTDRLDQALTAAIDRAAWCSADPVCMEAEGQGVDALNLAACHACALLPETSCEEMNILLDRGLLIGVPDDRDTGFFASLLTEG